MEDTVVAVWYFRVQRMAYIVPASLHPELKAPRRPYDPLRPGDYHEMLPTKYVRASLSGPSFRYFFDLGYRFVVAHSGAFVEDCYVSKPWKETVKS